MSKFSKQFITWMLAKRGLLMLLGCVVLAIFFRFWQLDHIPPALAQAEASSGLAARNLVEHFNLGTLGSVLFGREALFVILEASAVAVMGHTELAIRIVPALLGVLAVVTTYLWAHDWWGRRVGIVAALVMAVTPWMVILNRTAYSVVTVPLIVSTGLWLGGRAYTTGKFRWAIGAGVVMGTGCYAYPGGWPVFSFIALAILIGLIRSAAKRNLLRPISYVAAIGFISTPFLVGIGLSWHRIIVTPTASVFSHAVNQGNIVTSTLSASARTLLMINFHGDTSYAHNVGGEPALNIFIGLMAILGLLVSITMLRKPRYGILVGVVAMGLLPGVIGAGTSPDALRTLPALVGLAVMAGIGIDYMLSYWFKTFPINSAARTVGMASMMLLLTLCVYHGYTEYFVAWADAPGTYVAQAESTTELSRFINQYNSAKHRLIVTSPEDRGIVRYLAKQPQQLRFITAADIVGLPESVKPAQFIIDRSQHEAAIAALKLKFSGGQLRPHYSSYSDDELYDVYEVAQ